MTIRFLVFGLWGVQFTPARNPWSASQIFLFPIPCLGVVIEWGGGEYDDLYGV